MPTLGRHDGAAGHRTASATASPVDVALDGLIVTIVAAIVLISIRRDTDWFLDVALVVAFVGFVGTTAGARFIERRGG